MNDFAYPNMNLTGREAHPSGHARPWLDTAAVWILWLIPVVLSIFVRPVFPVDETRYLSVAWNMWQEGQFLVPMLNDAYYTHKPPLLFWLIHAGWSVFGVNDWWPRLIQPTAAIGSLLLLRGIAARLWPGRRSVRSLAPAIFAAGWFATLYAPAVMFDYLVVFSALLATYGLAGRPVRWPLVALGLALGLLSKGPVILVYTLPALLAAPWWTSKPEDGWRSWYLRATAVLALGAVPILAWLLMAWSVAGDAFLSEILWRQTADRISGDMGHGRPIWWYLPLLPLLGLPWIFWPPLWRAVRGIRVDRGLRLSFGSALVGFFILSLVGGKQAHYLLPLLALATPGIAMLLDSGVRIRRLDGLPLALILGVFGLAMMIPGLGVGPADWPEWVATISPGWGALLLMVAVALVWWRPKSGSEAAVFQLAATSLLALAVICGPVVAARKSHDLGEIASMVSDFQSRERPVAWLGHYQGQFNYTGRLQRPVFELGFEEARDWLAEHPDAIVATRTKHLAGAVPEPLFMQPYRSGSLALYRASDLVSDRTYFEP
ncbi:MAG: glycosyltransferase family 39 protein [Wenzhouxiangella sp.]|jgi:4-amino-4-deoxy-L-arabinose transferase-like glycosyltransferase|nr:glycosyltransferase family 39 protein [Wenzhouxiangella sp.]